MKNVVLALAFLLFLPLFALANDDFIHAARDGNLAAVQEYIKNGGDVNHKNPYGGTAIMFAARANHIEIAKVLINAKADLNIHGTYAGTTALIWAAQHGSSEIVKLLVEAGAQINAKNHKGETALTFANNGNYKEIADYLKSKGAK